MDHLYSSSETMLNGYAQLKWESTLSGKSLSTIIEKYPHIHDYSITVVFIYLANATECVERVAIGVEKGGIKFQLMK